MKPLQATVTSLSRTATKLNINVLGAGIAGLSSAKRLKEQFPAAKVTVIAESFLANTTTHGAAGVWGPYKLGDSPDEQIDALSSQTHEYLLGVCFSKHAAAAGVSLATGQILFTAPEPDPFWRDTVLGFCRSKPSDLSHYPPQYVDGYAYTTVVCEGRRYLPWMMADLRASGVAVVQARVGGLGEVARAGEHWRAPDLVVNCCGNAAAQLVNDDKAYPIRGQIARVKAPWIRHFLFADPYYIIPNQDFVVLGGTSQVGDSNLNVSLKDREAIAANTRLLMPSLEAAEHLDDWVGLRPGRTQLRLEADSVDGIPVVHNYGHGGSGLTLFWGCAGEVVHLAQSVL